MSTEIDYWYDKNTLLTGHVSSDDEVEDLAIIVYINGLDYDVTRGFSQDEFGLFKKRFLEYALDNCAHKLSLGRERKRYYDDDRDDDPEAA
ncbi:MAG: hypothetical protein AB7H97_04025 [Pseudobdellovibrionaceae bacterium]